MTTATTFSCQKDAGSRASDYFLLRKSRTRCRTRLRIEESLFGGCGAGEGNWAEITLVKTSGAVTKDGEKFDQKLTGAGRVQQATGGSISASIPFSFLKRGIVLLSLDLLQCRTGQVKLRNI